jgi:hypothetical protein
MAVKVSSFCRNTIADTGCRFNEIGWKTGRAEQLVAIPFEFRYTIVIGHQENTPC